MAVMTKSEGKCKYYCTRCGIKVFKHLNSIWMFRGTVDAALIKTKAALFYLVYLVSHNQETDQS